MTEKIIDADEHEAFNDGIVSVLIDTIEGITRDRSETTSWETIDDNFLIDKGSDAVVLDLGDKLENVEIAEAREDSRRFTVHTFLPSVKETGDHTLQWIPWADRTPR
jgi:hypothetical protein